MTVTAIQFNIATAVSLNKDLMINIIVNGTRSRIICLCMRSDVKDDRAVFEEMKRTDNIQSGYVTCSPQRLF